MRTNPQKRQSGRCVRPLLGQGVEVRGGSWNNNNPNNLRCANRNRNNPHNRNNNVGFRCANTVWRSAEMLQSWLLTPMAAVASVVDAQRPGVRRNAPCQKAVHALFRVGSTVNRIILATAFSSRCACKSSRPSAQWPSGGRAQPVSGFVQVVLIR